MQWFIFHSSTGNQKRDFLILWSDLSFIKNIFLSRSKYTEDLTRRVISYKIYETSLRRISSISYEMTTSVRFCLSYDPFKWDFIAFKVNIISTRQRIVDTDVVCVTCTRQSVMTRVVIRFL